MDKMNDKRKVLLAFLGRADYKEAEEIFREKN